jgi:hypothetical protein
VDRIDNVALANALKASADFSFLVLSPVKRLKLVSLVTIFEEVGAGKLHITACVPLREAGRLARRLEDA